jgi:hypothetical protein
MSAKPTGKIDYVFYPTSWRKSLFITRAGRGGFFKFKLPGSPLYLGSFFEVEVGHWVTLNKLMERLMILYTWRIKI